MNRLAASKTHARAVNRKDFARGVIHAEQKPMRTSQGMTDSGKQA